jgi:excisionase family DNA binding protein
MPEAAMTQLLTLTEAAERLRISRRTLERLVRAGRIRVVPIGSRRLVTERELEAFVAAQQRRGGA